MAYLKVVPTADGSSTLYSERFNAHYHSVNGALTESEHIFIAAGLHHIASSKKRISVLEVGLGTCLNAALTAKAAQELGLYISYLGIELYPPPLEVLYQLGLDSLLDVVTYNFWKAIVESNEGVDFAVNEFMSLRKETTDFINWKPDREFDLIYFDAFAPDDQPEMWSVECFRKLYECTASSGVLVTYSVKGLVKSNLREAGYLVERLPGPPGKRHMLRAVKP